MLDQLDILYYCDTSEEATLDDHEWTDSLSRSFAELSLHDTEEVEASFETHQPETKRPGRPLGAKNKTKPTPEPHKMQLRQKSKIDRIQAMRVSSDPVTVSEALLREED